MSCLLSSVQLLSASTLPSLHAERTLQMWLRNLPRALTRRFLSSHGATPCVSHLLPLLSLSTPFRMAGIQPGLEIASCVSRGGPILPSEPWFLL